VLEVLVERFFGIVFAIVDSKGESRPLVLLLVDLHPVVVFTRRTQQKEFQKTPSVCVTATPEDEEALQLTFLGMP
jgi:hypothetical protein